MPKDVSDKFTIITRMVVRLDDKILLIKRAEGKDHRAGIWEFPGGKLDSGENLETGVKRELLEEVGIETTEIDYDTSAYYDDERGDILAVVFICNVKDETIVLSGEHSEYRWVDKDNYKTVELTKDYENFIDKLFKQ